MEADEEENDLIKQGNVITKSNLTWNQFDCQQGLIKFVHGALITIRFCVNSRPMQEPTDPSASRPLIGHFITLKAPDWPICHRAGPCSDPPSYLSALDTL